MFREPSRTHRFALTVFAMLLLAGVALLPLGCGEGGATDNGAATRDGVATRDNTPDSADGAQMADAKNDDAKRDDRRNRDAKNDDAKRTDKTNADTKNGPTKDRAVKRDDHAKNGKTKDAKSNGKADTDRDGEPANTTGKHFLWKATKDGSEAVVYLLGSVHVAKKEIYPLGDPIDAAYKSADVLVLELKMDMATQMQAAQKLMQQGAMPAGQSLTDLLEGETKQQFEQRLKSAGPIGRQARRFKPAIATVFLTMEQLQKAGFDPTQGIDMHFYQRAAKDDKQILALETVDEQVDLFVDMPMKTQLLMLRHYLEEESGEMEKMMNELFKAWRKGDAAAVDKLILDSMQEEAYQPMFQAMFVDRNKKMTEKIGAYFGTDKTYFVVVGAGHLVGEEGIVALLKKNERVAVEQQTSAKAEATQ